MRLNFPTKLKQHIIWTIAIAAICYPATISSKWNTTNKGKLFAKSIELSTNKKTQPIYLALSMIWEGSDLKHYNLKAIDEFRRNFHGINVFHFISPAYFLKANSNPNEVRAKISSLIYINDEVGIYLQPWKSITDGARVIFRSSPTYWGNKISMDNCYYDCGKEVPLSIYRRDEIRKIIDYSIDVFNKNGFKKPRSFLSGGWLTSSDIAEIATTQGMIYDFSSTSSSLLKKRLHNYPLYTWIANRWKNVTPTTQPYPLPNKFGSIIEIGNNAATVDFVSVKEIVSLFKKHIEMQKNNPNRPLVFHLGFHQETAWQYIPRLSLALQKIFQLTNDHNAVMRPLSIPKIDYLGK